VSADTPRRETIAMKILPDRALCEQLLQADEANHAYFASRTELPGVALFTAERPDAAEFDLAVISRVAATEADATLATVIRHFQERGRRPRVRLGPLSEPADWAERLRRAGFVETDERYAFLIVPAMVQPDANPAVVVERAVTPEDADRFSAIQIAGFDIQAEHRIWDRLLARRHLAAGGYLFYLASLDGLTVGAARSIHLPGGVAALSALATLPAARGRGVGTSLLRHMIDDARMAGCTVLFGTVRPGGYAAGYYERIGWIPLFETRTFERRR
jgi:GNAT superfamily N-acetyltransferase